MIYWLTFYKKIFNAREIYVDMLKRRAMMIENWKSIVREKVFDRFHFTEEILKILENIDRV